MRMWMVDVKILCRQHLLGCHNELHKHRPGFVAKRSIAGRAGQIEPLAMKKRHDVLAEEMRRRGYNHGSPYVMPDLSYLLEGHRNFRVDVAASLKLLLSRCAECKSRFIGKEKEAAK